MVRRWVKYRNGNYTVYFNEKNGTKIRQCDSDKFEPQFPENCDVLISTKCDKGCPWCYAGCKNDGDFADLTNLPFLDTIHPYTEMAMNLNFPVHPQIKDFLVTLKEKKVFANVTVNQDHFMKHYDFIQELIDEQLIYGLGVSLTKPTKEFIELVSQYKNTVIHVINGIFNQEDYDMLKDNGLKILVLGYKDFGRGTNYHKNDNSNIQNNQNWLFENLNEVLRSFDTVSFDNLGLAQLDVKRLLSENEWKQFYMGDDGSVTFAINLVNRTFSRNSMSTIEYPIDNLSLEDMLRVIKEAEI